MGLRKTIIKYNPLVKVRQHTERKRLQKNVTILASNCMGGLLYHDLGQQFLSPTVNTRFDSPDFVRFVCNIHDYLMMELKFIPSDETFPVAMLGDVRVNFVHYHTNEEAEKKWKERIARIDWDNVYVITNDNDGMTEADFAALDACEFKNVLAFTSKPMPQHRCAFQMKQFGHLSEVGNTMLRSIFTGEMEVQKSFDFVAWFNHPMGGADLEQFRK